MEGLEYLKQRVLLSKQDYYGFVGVIGCIC